MTLASDDPNANLEIDQQAPPMNEHLQDVLADGRMVSLTKVGKAASSRARAAQAEYDRNARIFIFAGAIATIAGALILLGTGVEGESNVLAPSNTPHTSETTPETIAENVSKTLSKKAGALAIVQGWLSTSSVRMVLFVVEMAALAATAFSTEILRSAKSAVTWVEERRRAEELRITRFETMFEIAREKDNGSGHAHETAAFDHFIEEQLNGQIKYHEDKEKTTSANLRTSIRFGAYIAAALAATGAIGVGGQLWFVIAAFVGVVAPIVLNALNQWREKELNSEKSKASKIAWEVLTRASGRAEIARAGLAGDDPTEARKLVETVHTLMADVDQAWIATRLSV